MIYIKFETKYNSKVIRDRVEGDPAPITKAYAMKIETRQKNCNSMPDFSSCRPISMSVSSAKCRVFSFALRHKVQLLTFEPYSDIELFHFENKRVEPSHLQLFTVVRTSKYVSPSLSRQTNGVFISAEKILYVSFQLLFIYNSKLPVLRLRQTVWQKSYNQKHSILRTVLTPGHSIVLCIFR